jgi:uncharacterized protein HemY
MRRANNPHGISRILDELGKLAIDMNVYNIAECYLNEAMTIAGANEEWAEIARIFRHFGDLARLGMVQFRPSVLDSLNSQI